MPTIYTQLTPNLYVGRSRLFHTNHGIFVSTGQACLIDPGIYYDELDALARFVSGQGATVQSIILTHSHWDHILGPQHFPAARIIAQASYLTSIRDGKDVIIKSIAAWQKEGHIQPAGPFVIPLPTETFDQTTTLMLGSLTLRLTHAPGHAADQLTVYHPESATLWAADMLSDREIPFVSYDLEAYRRTLATLATWDIRALIPGHGHATTDQQEIHDRLTEDIAYLDQLRANVQTALHQGKTMEETVELCLNMPYRNRSENETPHRWNVETAYVQLGGRANKTMVGWDQEGD